MRFHLSPLFPALALACAILPGCGGGDPPPAGGQLAEAGPGAYQSGPLGEPFRLCSLAKHAEAAGELRVRAEVRGLAGDAFWRVQVNGGAPLTGRLLPDGAGGALGAAEFTAAPGDRIEVDLFAHADRGGSASWKSAALELLPQ